MSKYSEQMKRNQDKRDAQIKAWISEGKTMAFIAKELGVSRQRAYVLKLRISA